jgi:hypothetical protein
MTLNPTGYARFPVSVATAIWDAVGATYSLNCCGGDVSQVVPSVPCSYITNSSTIDISFVGIASETFTMHVPMSDITWRNGSGPNLNEGPLKVGCRLSILAQQTGLPGGFSPGMLKNVYAVYDLDNMQLSVATPDWTDGRSDDILPIPAAGVAALGESVLGNNTVAVAGSSTSTGSDDPTSKSRSNSVTIGIGVGVGVVALLTIAAGILWWRRKIKRTAEIAGQSEEGFDDKMLSDGEFGGGNELMATHEVQRLEMAGHAVGSELSSGEHKDGRMELDGHDVQVVRYELGS